MQRQAGQRDRRDCPARQEEDAPSGPGELARPAVGDPQHAHALAADDDVEAGGPRPERLAVGGHRPAARRQDGAVLGDHRDPPEGLGGVADRGGGARPRAFDGEAEVAGGDGVRTRDGPVHRGPQAQEGRGRRRDDGQGRPHAGSSKM